MKSVTTAEFQTQCAKLIKEVMKTGVSVVILDDGQPVAQLGPVPSQASTLVGAHKGKVRIIGDILEPIDDASGEPSLAREGNQLPTCPRAHPLNIRHDHHSWLGLFLGIDAMPFLNTTLIVPR